MQKKLYNIIYNIRLLKSNFTLYHIGSSQKGHYKVNNLANINLIGRLADDTP